MNNNNKVYFEKEYKQKKVIVINKKENYSECDELKLEVRIKPKDCIYDFDNNNVKNYNCIIS